LLWAISKESKLSDSYKKAIASEENIVFVSMASLWELTIKESIGKIRLPKQFMNVLSASGYEILSISLNHLETLRELPLHHRDPFDRLIIAQAKAEQLLLASTDQIMQKYSVSILP
jgi:PIN domain nuclease of toxin-antitoxin system